MNEHGFYKVRPDGTIEAPDGSVIVADLKTALELAEQIKAGKGEVAPPVEPRRGLPVGGDLVVPRLPDLGDGPRQVLQALVDAVQETGGAGVATKVLAEVAGVKSPSGLASTSRAIKGAIKPRLHGDDAPHIEDVFWTGTTSRGKGWFVSPELLLALGLVEQRSAENED